MVSNDIITLARAGYNSEQIAVIMAQAAAPAAAPPAAPAAPAEEAPAAPAAPAAAAPAAPAAPAAAAAPAAPAPAAPAAPAAHVRDPILEQLEKLTGAIQSSAILATTQPKEETAESILASIINPPEKK